MVRSTRWALCAAVGIVIATPGLAQATATKNVNMGLPPASQKTFNEKYSSDVNDFFPHAITINAGDSVRFVPTGFHDVNLPKKGGGAVAPFTPTGQKIAGVNDAAGAPFWFNDQPAVGFNPALVARSGFGRTFSYTGSKAVLSGLPVSNKPKPMTVRFPKTGLFRYVCDLHPGMAGTVRVLARGKGVPSQAGDAKRVKAQVAAALAVAKTLVKNAKLAANTIAAGLQGAHGVNLFGFVPDKLDVPVGTTVSFVAPVNGNEPHTATAGPGDPEKEPASYLGQIAASFESPAPDPRGLLPSEPPATGPAPLTPQLHGNGFWSTGLLDGIPATPLPRANAVNFAAAGTYQFICAIHPFMRLTITAT